jgi:hypothetical protein
MENGSERCPHLAYSGEALGLRLAGDPQVFGCTPDSRGIASHKPAAHGTRSTLDDSFRTYPPPRWRYVNEHRKSARLQCFLSGRFFGARNERRISLPFVVMPQYIFSFCDQFFPCKMPMSREDENPVPSSWVHGPSVWLPQEQPRGSGVCHTTKTKRSSSLTARSHRP